MNKEGYINEAEKNILHTYNRFSLVLDHGEGVYLYDTDGKEYLDFAAGIAVQAFGYGNKEYGDALKAQIDKIMHTSNLYYNVPIIHAAERVKKASGMDRVFFTNSGTEAIEGAIKAAKKYAYTRDGHAGHEIIAMNHSFHGRSMGALSVTGNDAYQAPFKPLIGGVRFAEYNNLESVKSLITDRTCGIILEALQGEGGIYPASKEFMQGLRALCDEHDILLVCDEIQCGMGRTGNMFCYQSYDILPDVVCVAKALGNGLPIGAFLCREECAALVPGDHGSTYGGNPLVCAAANAVMDQFEELNLTAHVKEVGAYLYEQLEQLTAEFDCIKDHRGIGLMQGIELTIPVGDVIKKAQKEGLIIISASGNVIRFVPPLVIEKKHVDEMIAKLKKCLQ